MGKGKGKDKDKDRAWVSGFGFRVFWVGLWMGYGRDHASIWTFNLELGGTGTGTGIGIRIGIRTVRGRKKEWEENQG